MSVCYRIFLPTLNVGSPLSRSLMLDGMISLGSDEGIYAWVAANYARGTLGGDPHQTTGIVELGGASAQVTFVSSDPMPPEFLHTVKFGEFTYNLYSHSLLHFGQNVAYDSLREFLVSRDQKLAAESLRRGISIDPCTPKGYSHGMGSWSLTPGSSDGKNKYLSSLHAGGNFSECRSAALMLLQKGKEKCSYQHCHFFGLGPTAFLSGLMLAGQQFCEEDWSKLKRKYHSLDEDNLLRYCFSSAYIVALLHDSLGIAMDDERIEFANQVGNIPLDWALGAFILQNTAGSDVEHPDWIATIINKDSSTLLSLFVISTLLICTAWFVSKWRKPQLKTIYDLEKGRYIVMRV
ncbi:hypothetical protein HHK36_024724 [Tetracentron sinense]|uniref:Apyrase n=1 Tax=Tetracentron sinense TaxID=13715 RepID=A0A834YQJ5_TETSI|nr:hypothetical protein HHK36_024724 [Tetracentron sinense]